MTSWHAEVQLAFVVARNVIILCETPGMWQEQ